MTEQPMHAYAVSLVFGTGPIVANVVVAPSPEAAAALILNSFMRVVQPKEELSGVAVVPIAPEWLGRAKDAVEGKERGQVLHLVPTPEPPMPVSRDQKWEADKARILASDAVVERVNQAQLADSEIAAAAAQCGPWPPRPQQIVGIGRVEHGELFRYCSRHPMHRIIDGICPLCAPPLSGGAA